jgi:serine phosphatase RsbU (regulator of sigma subunit)
VVLAKLSNLLDFDSTQRFATVLIGKVDIPGRRLTLASAGHFPPLIVAGEQSRFVEIPVEAPVGISKGQQAPTVTADVPPGATVIAFTDGLVERRGENLDISLARLRRVAMGLRGPVDASLDRLAAELIPAGANDDVVILGLRWRN